MRDGQDCAILELGRDHLLDQLVVLDVDVGSGLVDQDDLAVLQEGPADAQKLFLPHRQVLVSDLGVDAALLPDDVTQVALLHNLLDLLVSVLVARVKILTDSAIDEGGLLLDHRHAGANVLQAVFYDALAVDEDLALSRLKNSEERADERGLACACATHNADFLAVLDVDVDVFEHQVKFFSIPCAVVLEGNVSL